MYHMTHVIIDVKRVNKIFLNSQQILNIGTSLKWQTKARDVEGQRKSIKPVIQDTAGTDPPCTGTGESASGSVMQQPYIEQFNQKAAEADTLRRCQHT